MRLPLRLAVFAVGAGGLGALLLWASTGLPEFGLGHSPYAELANRLLPADRHLTNAVTGIVFDLRGFDTLIEEAILFASVTGIAMLLRDAREGVAPGRDEVQSDAIRALGMLLVPCALVLALYTIAHGHLTPGGGFQGGVILAGAVALVYAAGRQRDFDAIAPSTAWDAVEGVGLAAYVVVGLLGLVAGGAFLENVLPLGLRGAVASAGTIPVLSWAAGLAVGAGFVLLFREFLDQLREEEESQ